MMKKDGKEIKAGIVIFITVSLFLIVFGILGITAKVWKALKRLKGGDMKILISMLLVLVLCIGCAGPKIIGDVPKDSYVLEDLLAKARTLEPDNEGWRTLAIPDKDFNTNFIEFVVFVKDKSWGVGMVQHGPAGRSAVTSYTAEIGRWFMIMDGTFPTELSPEQAQKQIEQLLQVINENGDFTKMRRFTILIPIQPQGV